jgi:Uma2 family endonuclease
MTVGTTITWEQFLAAGEEGQRWEWVDGEVEFMSPASLRHEKFLFHLIGRIALFCESNPEWAGFGSNAVFAMKSGNWREPDAALVRRARLPQPLPDFQCDFPPDVAFEVQSPSNTPSSIQRKRKDYQQSGVVQVWFDLDARLVEVNYPDRPAAYFKEDDVLTIDTVPRL